MRVLQRTHRGCSMTVTGERDGARTDMASHHSTVTVKSMPGFRRWSVRNRTQDAGIKQRLVANQVGQIRASGEQYDEAAAIVHFGCAVRNKPVTASRIFPDAPACRQEQAVPFPDADPTLVGRQIAGDLKELGCCALRFCEGPIGGEF
jgi:hypothetical protein